LAEWLYESGIGEDRAVLVDAGEIVEAAIELPGLRSGTIAQGRLTEILVPGRRGLVATAAGDILVEPLPPALSKGRSVRVEILREALPEAGRPKLAKGAITDLQERPGPTLVDRVGGAAPAGPHGSDRFEEAGWSELLEQAAGGEIMFGGGALRMSLTPAMTLFDVDGAAAPAELALAGARAAARAIRRMGIAGSIGIDLPTLASRSERQRVAAAFDEILPPPFERTAVNGFGFLQVVRRRERPSLPEILQSDPSGAAARALLRRAERQTGPGERLLIAAPAVVARLESEPGWIEELQRRIAAPVRLQAQPGLAISAAHVQSAHAPR
jgi:ribonuclease G